MKTKFFALIALSFVSLSAFAGTTCSSFDNKLQLSIWQYEGGPAPFPGMEVGRTIWTYDGKVIAKQTTVAGQQSTNLGIDVKHDKYTLLDSKVGSAWAVTYFTEFVTLTQLDGTAIAEEFLLCKYEQNFYP